MVPRADIARDSVRAPAPAAAAPNRLDATLDGRRPTLICYLPLGDPEMPAELPEVYRDAGADVLEIGVPVADPFLDGPVVGGSMARAASSGLDIAAWADLIADLRRRLPTQAMVWMTYAGALAEASSDVIASSGVDAVLAPLAGRSLDGLAGELEARAIHFLRFVSAPPRPEEVEVARGATGYVMVQTAPGVTGVRPSVASDLGDRLARLRADGVTAPLAAGFGISTPAQASEVMRAGADAVIVGSAVVEAARASPEEAGALIASIRHAVDAG